MTEASGSARRAEIINRVLSKGLKSAVQLLAEGAVFSPSDDEFPREVVCGINLWNFHLQYGLNETDPFFRRRLYSDCESIFPVLLERPGEKRTHNNVVRAVLEAVLKKEMEKRAAATFLVTCQYDTKEDEWVRGLLSHIPLNRFSYLVFPRPIYDEFQTTPNPVALPEGVKLRVVDRLVERRIEDHIDIDLEVPDYESELVQILRESTPRNLFVHGVRLPLDRDTVLFRTT